MMRQRQEERGGKDEGSMVVEAAMILPVFLLFVLFLIFIIQMTLYSTALQSTASDTVKMISAHMYPAALAMESLEDKNGGTQGEAEPGSTGASGSSGSLSSGASGSSGSLASGSYTIPRLSLEQWSADFAGALPEPLDQWVEAAIRRGEAPLQQLQAETSEAVLDLAVKPLLKPYITSDWLDYERIHVSNVTVPNLKGNGEAAPYFGLVVSYTLPMKVPFLNQKIVLEASAAERVWIGATGNTKNSDAEGNTGNENSIVVLEKPDPGVANRQGKIRVKVPPHARANLSIFYKSGQSTAKYLGWKEADDQGYIEWEWKIGVNTTPGSWPFVIQLEDGTALEATFTVVKRSGEKEK
ncbi:TadE/TadG family type IV pilus assembly protein [Paenibacillus tengchongensis]|uniref:TadE/TadG family type IV pilus assembly protein n=1 Tax=Paenibacillus tengchongensis TaxID=2608684 RepID=UPI001FE24D40|nr:TadE/TadG family type IV pilus assembly protein [Paenibacillus tengchongensis]